MKRWIAAIFLASLLCASVHAQPYTGAIVIEPTTRRILFEKDAHTPRPVASMTKMMNLLIVMENIQEGMLTLDTPVTTSAHASKMGGSQVYLKEGEVFLVRELLAATMVHSANDAAMALAERVGGTAEAFVNLMNQKAEQLGMKNSKFYSPHGLPGEGAPDDVMSPYDAALLGLELVKNPLMKQLAATKEMPFRNGTYGMTNPNHLLRNYPGATGIKTGFHDKAGFCVTGSAKRGNMELVAVVMGSKIKKDNFESAANLLSEAFANYRLVEPVKKGARLAQPVIVEGGEISAVPVVAGESATVLLRRGEKGVETSVVSANAQAPIRKGQQIGTVLVKLAGRPVAKVPAVAAIDVPQSAWWKRTWDRVWPF